MCKRCNKIYYESDNFNWSCRTHLGKFSGQMYWCCGRNGREALGCYVSKHEPKNEEEEDGRLEGVYNPNDGAICSSCRQIGHKAHECLRDPNVRSGQDPFDEDIRIDGIRKKKKVNADNADTQIRLMKYLELRLGGFAFGNDQVTSFDSSEPSD